VLGGKPEVKSEVSGSMKTGFLDQMGDCQLLRKDSLGKVCHFIRVGLISFFVVQTSK
jgi:hypothetical protein